MNESRRKRGRTAAGDESIFRHSFFSSHEAMMIAGRDGRLKYVNSAFTTLFGYQPEEIVGLPVTAISEPAASQHISRQVLRELSRRRRPFWRGELSTRRKDGSLMDALLTVSPVIDDGNTVTAFVVTAANTSHRRQFEQRLVEQEKLTSLGLLAAGLAHEIGSPLNVISGRAEMAKVESENCGNEIVEAVHKSLDIIIQQTERISQIVSAMLHFSQPSHHIAPEQFVQVELEHALDECRNLLGKQLDDKAVRLIVHRDAPTRIIWDLHKAAQVFFNLLQNAIHAVEGRPQPTVTVRFEPAGKADLSGLEPRAARGLAVRVQDNGGGIPAENLKRIFDPFFTTKEIGTGTGLGLSVVYGLVREVGGQVLVESAEGHGTTFTLVFALQPNPS